jgi:beta-phosphoglucomutase-like phosphatase (HAD superfamily)
MKRFALVIFDCDGVLVDSELITNRVFTSMLNELGLPVTTEEAFDRFVGRSMAQCLEVIGTLLGREVPVDFVKQYHLRTMAALNSNLKTVPGIEAVLETIQVPYCVASNGSHEKMQTTLGITGYGRSGRRRCGNDRLRLQCAYAGTPVDGGGRSLHLRSHERPSRSAHPSGLR